ncbi:LTA synthase family protein [Actinobacillus delphinicola]|uniref:Sulfatase n=1 Tax=Actinobacillus delphinicola TaxID=51161 RepID=A0A448TW60_9PAST|nr:LTA synthase family protein [Actinobacillus delphinicola]VEJ10153.1 sulfatase [Actinobacillus delphinicola]
MQLRKKLGALYPLVVFFLINLAVFFVSRLGLCLWQSSRVSAVNGWHVMFIQGLRIDISTLCWLFALPIILTYFLASNNAFGRVINFIIRIYLVAISAVIAFMEAATPAFINTYDFRPNRLFFEYLNSPKEVFSMLAAGHTFALIVTPIVTILMIIAYWKISGRVMKNITYRPWYWRIVAFLIVGGLTFMGARSSFEHRPINPSMVAFSPDALVNSLVLNSTYSLGFAINQMQKEANAAELYGKMPLPEIIKLVREAQHRPDSIYLSKEYPTWIHHDATYKGKPKNLVIILEESLGAQFIGALGDKRGLSPNLDQLSKEGWWFKRLYATGTRSVRGIEATITGFTPTPARSVVKLPLSQHGFFTIARVLKEHGYDTSFIYGGEKQFDNMATFFYNNGIDTIIDQNDYKNPKFVGTWGVSDEDLFDRANATFTKLAKEGKPFFSLVFSSSNHDPFEYPDGKIKLYDKEKATRNNAAKYADYAIGQFFKMAKNSDYWKNTVFLVIADHDSRVFGATLVPVQHFHIPALIIGAGIKPRQDNRLVSQLDMPTTLLSAIGISADYPMLGQDLTTDEDLNRNFMQFDKTFAYRVGNDVVLLQPSKAPAGYTYNPETHKLTPAQVPELMKKEALAYALWGSYAYAHHLYPASITPSKK